MTYAFIQENTKFAPAVSARVHGMRVQASEAAAEVLVLVPRQVLVAEGEHHPVAQGAAHVGLLARVERLRKVDAADLRANVGRQRAQRKAVVVEIPARGRRLVRHGDEDTRSPLSG